MTMLDTRKKHETPEGIVLRLRIAGPCPRACAWLLDFIIRVGLCILCAIVLGMMGKSGTGIMLVIFFLMEWFYPVVFECYKGSTPGKIGLGLVVVHDNGTPVTFSASVVRNLLRAVDFLPLFYGAGLLTMLFQADFKRLGDLAAGTIVVYREEKKELQAISNAEPIQPPRGLSVEEQQILLEFSNRSGTLSMERRMEVADILTGMTGKRGEDAVYELEGYAGWISRGR